MSTTTGKSRKKMLGCPRRTPAPILKSRQNKWVDLSVMPLKFDQLELFLLDT